jgi:glucan biosynthesis protein
VGKSGRIGKPNGPLPLKNEYTGGYRLEFDVVREQSDDIELRATLRSDTRALTETWSYLWQPTR